MERGWDEVEGEQDPKSVAGHRTVPDAEPLRRELVEHGLLTKRNGDDLVFRRTATEPFIRSTVRSRANAAWKAAGLDPITPHEARHCAASFLIAAGLNSKELSVRHELTGDSRS